MVKLEEVTDEHFTAHPDDSDWDTDDDSDASSTISYLEDESLSERLAALKDIIPATRRAQLSSGLQTATEYVSTGLLWSGKAVWVLSTSALLLGVPWMLAYAGDQEMAEMEQQQRMQMTANEFLTPGAGDANVEKTAL